MSETPRPTISGFADLLELALQEPGPARLLTVLVRAEAVMTSDADGREVPVEGEGLLKPVMVKDHAITPEMSFEQLREEADRGNDRWTFMMTAVLPGQAGQPPAPDTVEQQLKHMARTIHTGEGIDSYLFLDRDGEPVQIGLPG